MESLKLNRVGAALFASASVLVAAGVGVAPAWAHDAVVGGSPADGQVVEQFPSSITLDFSGVPQEGFNTMSVLNQDQEILFTGEPVVEGQSITIDVPEDLDPGAGEYTVGFQITSSDGHATRGKTTFTVEGDPAAAGNSADLAPESDREAHSDENQNPSNNATTEESFDSAAAVIGSLAAVLAVGAVIVLLIRRNKMGQ